MVLAEEDVGVHTRFTVEGEERVSTAASRVREGLNSTAEAAQTFTGTAMAGIHIITRYEVSMMRLEVATNRVENSQMNYDKTVKKYGASSQEAIKAANNLTNAQARLERANFLLISSYMLMGTTALAQVPKLLSLAGAQWAVAASARAMMYATAGLTGFGFLFMALGMLGGGFSGGGGGGFGQTTSYVSFYNTNNFAMGGMSQQSVADMFHSIIRDEISRAMQVR